MIYFHLLTAMLAKKQQKIIYGTSDEVEACNYWAEETVVLSFDL